jgi:hypothetical protein
MAGWMKGAFLVAGAMAGGAAAVATAGGRNWKRTTSRAVERLESAVSPERTGFVRSPDGLPPPVARYFDFALTSGRPYIRSARIEHAGRFRVGGLKAGWSPFRSVQHFTADPPGFVWDASIRMAPLLSVRVRDSYVRGRGAMLGKLAGAVSVVDQQGTPELAAGALNRWLAEAVWFPTALLPRPGLAWQAVDDSTARATFTDSGNAVSMDCHFADDGRILRIAALRYRDVDGDGVPTPWEVELGEYTEVDGMRIPSRAKVAWLLPEGRLSYWRARIEAAEYEYYR